MIISFFQSLLAPGNLLLLFAVFFIVRFMVFTTLENFFVAHAFKRSEVIISDIVTMLSYTVIIFPLAYYISNHIGVQGTFFSYLSSAPLLFRVLLFFIVADFLHYWIHRLMHTAYVWRVHMWHHSPSHMSWMGGFRATVFDSTLVNLPFIFAWPILGSVSYPIIICIFACNILLNDWMHLNINFKLRGLSWVFITPRYHHIHHSVNEEHYTKNLAAIFPLWDKLFGTYINPDTVDTKITFGLQQEVKTSRLVTGL